MAVEAHTTRRALFAIASAATLLPSIAFAGTDDAVFHVWKRESAAAWEKANQSNIGDAQIRKWCLRAHDFDQKIIETPARSKEAFVIKCETLERIATENRDEEYAACFAQLRAYIAGLN